MKAYKFSFERFREIFLGKVLLLESFIKHHNIYDKEIILCRKSKAQQRTNLDSNHEMPR